MQKLIEIGCGEGFNSSVLQMKKNVLVTGVDLSEKNIKVAKERYPHINFLQMNVESLEFQEASFDEIYAMDILEHVDCLDSVIKECVRVLKVEGKFIINIPAEKSERWLLKIRPTYFHEIHHVRIFKHDDLENLLSRYGFIVKYKKPKGFLQHIELYYLFTRNNKSSDSQLGIGHWRDSIATKLIHSSLIFFDPIVLKTPLKYVPFWIITVPIGFVINYIGNKIFPKSWYYEFEKRY